MPPAPPALEDSLRAMEPALPAPPEQLMTGDELMQELDMADTADGTLPHFPRRTAAAQNHRQIAAETAAARHARGEAAWAKAEAGGTLTDEEFADQCFHLDPTANARRRRQPR